jgi:hypothetical protein
MRHVLILVGRAAGPGSDDDGPPFVLAESPDAEWLQTEALTWSDGVVLPIDDARADPDFADAVADWECKEDRLFAEREAVTVAESALDAARIQAQIDGLVERDQPPADESLQGAPFPQVSTEHASPADSAYATFRDAYVAANQALKDDPGTLKAVLERVALELRDSLRHRGRQIV